MLRKDGSGDRRAKRARERAREREGGEGREGD